MLHSMSVKVFKIVIFKLQLGKLFLTDHELTNFETSW